MQRLEKRVSSWEEGLSSLSEGEWAVAESKREMTQRMRRMTKRQRKKIEEEIINMLFDATWCIRNFFHSQVKTYKSSCKLLTMSRVSCGDELFIKWLISKKKKKERKKRKERVTPGWTDISGPGSVNFLSRSSMCYITLTLHNPINLLNVASTNSFSRVSTFISLTTWCTNDLRRLQFARINNSDTKFICSSFPFVKRK